MKTLSRCLIKPDSQYLRLSIGIGSGVVGVVKGRGPPVAHAPLNLYLKNVPHLGRLFVISNTLAI